MSAVPRAHATLPAFGVEEEFLLLDPRSGAVAPSAPGVIEDCGVPDLIGAEAVRFMVETRTPVSHSVAEVHQHLRSTRQRLALASAGHGLTAVPSGVAPYGAPAPPPMSDDPRYHEMARRYPRAMRATGTCSCHVHVGVPSRQEGLEVLHRLRPWLPGLIALTANSPIWRGRATGWASQRWRFQSRWPTSVPAPLVSSTDDYDRSVEDAVASGAAFDHRSVYFLARLSPRYPTVEVRLADVPLDPEVTAAYAGLVRALVVSALADVAAGEPSTPVEDSRLREACRTAASRGITGTLHDPVTGEDLPGQALVDRLLEHSASSWGPGEDAPGLSVLTRLCASGGDARRQQDLFARGGTRADFVAGLAAAMT